MAIGIPVIARPVAGISDFLVDGSTGLAIPSASPTHTANAIGRALSSAARLRAITRRARQMVERRYAWDRTVEAFESLYLA
jgi:glycosyltransferase involved in cell wall biosynthesis